MLQLARNHGPSAIYVDALQINGDAPKKEDPGVLEQRGAVAKLILWLLTTNYLKWLLNGCGNNWPTTLTELEEMPRTAAGHD